MALTTLLTSNCQIQYEPAEYSGPGETSGVQKRAEAFVTGCEPDCGVLCEWSGVAAGTLFGPSNRVIVTLTKLVRSRSKQWGEWGGGVFRELRDLGVGDSRGVGGSGGCVSDRGMCAPEGIVAG
jgi:hypothetical protein